MSANGGWKSFGLKDVKWGGGSVLAGTKYLQESAYFLLTLEETVHKGWAASLSQDAAW